MSEPVSDEIVQHQAERAAADQQGMAVGVIIYNAQHPDGISLADLEREAGMAVQPELPPPGYVLGYDRDHPQGMLRPEQPTSEL